MKVARLTATRIHQRLLMVIGLPCPLCPVLRSCTTFLYVVHEAWPVSPVRRIVVNCECDPDDRDRATAAEQGGRGREWSGACRRRGPGSRHHPPAGSRPGCHADGALLAFPQQGRVARRPGRESLG